jgi:hypothetical protein
LTAGQVDNQDHLVMSITVFIQRLPTFCSTSFWKIRHRPRYRVPVNLAAATQKPHLVKWDPPLLRLSMDQVPPSGMRLSFKQTDISVIYRCTFQGVFAVQISTFVSAILFCAVRIADFGTEPNWRLQTGCRRGCFRPPCWPSS